MAMLNNQMVLAREWLWTVGSIQVGPLPGSIAF